MLTLAPSSPTTSEASISSAMARRRVPAVSLPTRNASTSPRVVATRAHDGIQPPTRTSGTPPRPLPYHRPLVTAARCCSGTRPSRSRRPPCPSPASTRLSGFQPPNLHPRLLDPLEDWPACRCTETRTSTAPLPTGRWVSRCSSSPVFRNAALTPSITSSTQVTPSSYRGMLWSAL